MQVGKVVAALKLFDEWDKLTVHSDGSLDIYNKNDVLQGYIDPIGRVFKIQEVYPEGSPNWIAMKNIRHTLDEIIKMLNDDNYGCNNDRRNTARKLEHWRKQGFL